MDELKQAVAAAPTPPADVATTAGAAEASPDAGSSFYRKVYTRLYRWGYHSRLDYCHSKDLCRHVKEEYEFDSVLDIGCSNGWTVDFFSGAGIRASGVDVSEVAVRRAQGLGRDVRLACATRLPFGDDSFDAVLSTDCFEHLRPQDTEQAIREACRVARRYLFLTIHSDRDHDNWWRIVAGMALHQTIRPPEHWIERFLGVSGGTLLRRDGGTFIIRMPEAPTKGAPRPPGEHP